MDWKSTTLISGAGVLATWVFSMPAAAPPAASPAAAVAPQPPAQALDIQREAARLQMRLHPESNSEAPSRNPFQFATRTARATAPETAPGEASAPAALVAPIPLPVFSLDGVATDMIDGQEQHTAILHTDEGIVLVKEGDMVSGQYRVMSVGPAAAELQNVGSGSVVRLVLR